MTAWPSLPKPLINTFKETPPDNSIRTEMETGYDKVRRRSTAASYPMSFDLFLTPAQTATLDTFYNSTTKSGSLSFDFTHPRTAATVSARFTSPPNYSDVNGINFRATIALEILP